MGALERQGGAPTFDVVLVDDGSPDDTWATIERLVASSMLPVHGVRMVTQSGPAAARNAGWRAAKGSLVLFTDDDCVPQPGWLSTLAGALAEVDVAQGCTQPDPEQLYLLGPFARTMEVRSETGYYQTCNVGYRRSVLQAVDGFDDELWQAGEDIDLAIRAVAAGASTTFCSQAVVHHDVRPSSLRGQLRGTPPWAGVVLARPKQPARRGRRRWAGAVRAPARRPVPGDGLSQRALCRRARPLLVSDAAGLLAVVAGRSASARAAGAVPLVPYIRNRLAVEPLPHTDPTE